MVRGTEIACSRFCHVNRKENWSYLGWDWNHDLSSKREDHGFDLIPSCTCLDFLLSHLVILDTLFTGELKHKPCRLPQLPARTALIQLSDASRPPAPLKRRLCSPNRAIVNGLKAELVGVPFATWVHDVVSAWNCIALRPDGSCRMGHVFGAVNPLAIKMLSRFFVGGPFKGSTVSHHFSPPGIAITYPAARNSVASQNMAYFLGLVWCVLNMNQLFQASTAVCVHPCGKFTFSPLYFLHRN